MRGLYHAFSVLPKDTAEWGRFFRSVRFGLSDGRDAETVIDSKAPKDAQYLVGATNDTLTAERLVTDTSTIAWDLATAGQAKASLAYERTAAEIAAGVTPSNYAYEPGDVRRYGAATDGTSDSSTAVTNAAAANTEITFPQGYTFCFNATVSASITVQAHGATLKPFAAGKVFHCTGVTTRVAVWGGHLDMSGFAATGGGGIGNGDIGFYGDQIAALELFGVRTSSGAYPVLGNQCGLIRVHDCDIDAAGQWGAYSYGCTDTFFTENRVSNTVTFDGLKCGGATGSDALVNHGRIVITDNILRDNATDGIDVAINGATIVKIHDNEGTGNGERLVDFKVLSNTNGSGGVELCSIQNNDGVTSAASPVLISAQDGNYAGNVKQLVIAGNNLRETTAVSTASAIRVQDIDRPMVYNNRAHNFYYGVRLQGCDDGDVFDNNLTQTVRGVITESSSASSAVSDRNKVHDNRIRPQDHNSGAGNAVRFDVGDANEVYDNDFDAGNSQYTVADENTAATSATNTRIGRNRRGFATAIPTGNRAVPGEYWENSAITHGAPDRWVCNTATTSTTTTNLRAQGQVSYRTGSVAPSANANFVGEEFLDTTAGRWYKAIATGTGASDWAALN